MNTEEAKSQAARDYFAALDFDKDFPGIILPHKTIGAIVTMVAAMGGDWCDF